MREAVSLASASVSREPVPNRSPWRRLAAWVCLVVWTALVITALYFLFRPSGHDGSGPVLVQQNDTKTFLERSRDWFRLAHVNFSRIYPWLFFGPYVAWLGWRFSLERGRWRVSLPAHLAAGTAFVLAAHAINSRVSSTTARVVIINSEHQSVSGPARGELHSIQVAVSRDMGPAFHGEFSSAFSTGLVTRAFTNGAGPMPVDPLANAAFTNLVTELRQAVGAAPVGPPALFAFRPLSTLLDICAYAALVGLAHAVHFYQRFRERERCALMLESNLAKARLGALQAQLQPHFLFNTLNAIATLLRRDPRAAEATVLSLSELLRLTLSRSDRQESPMREEIHFAQRYFAIQQTRFGERLQLEVDIAPEAMDCLVPTLLLQPLVENAIRHGIEPSDDAGHIWLKAHRREQTLVLTVEDDGVGLGPPPTLAIACEPLPANAAALNLNPNLNLNLSPNPPIETPVPSNNHLTSPGGVGLTNLRARLEALYGPAQKLELSPRPGGGVVVRLEIPWHCASRNTAQLQANR